MPDLIIIAGCNGAGKSTFSSSFLPDGLNSFDYDRLFLENYNSIQDSELREEFAKNQTTKDFESSIDKALLNKADFCYETNFDSHPLYWAQKFRENWDIWQKYQSDSICYNRKLEIIIIDYFSIRIKYPFTFVL